MSETNATPAPKIRERSTFLKWGRWLTSWRGIRRVLIVVGWTVTAVALFYGEENWRGRHAWNKYKQEAEARGVTLDLASLIPKPIPDEENFAATPFLKSLFNTNPYTPALTNDLWSRAYVAISDRNVTKERGWRHFTDLAAWQEAAETLRNGPFDRNGHLSGGFKFATVKTDLASRAAAAPAVLEGMKPDAAVFAELREASRRPASAISSVRHEQPVYDPAAALG